MTEYNGTNNDGLVISLHELLTYEQINKDLTEKVMKECWHELLFPDDTKCNKCGSSLIINSSFTTSWANYGRLLEKVQKINYTPRPSGRGKFDAFIDSLAKQGYSYISYILLNPSTGSRAIWEFFCKSHTEKEES